MQKRVNFVVTDLDDTIWDWLAMWHGSFSPFLERISKDLSVSKDDLKKDFKQLHQKYGTSESSFIIEELSLLTEAHRDLIRADVEGGKGILHEYNSNKKNKLQLYDGVLKTLTSIKSKGALIVGFTESHSFYTKYRIKTLNLDGLLDCIYAPIDVGLPASVKRYYDEDYWEPEKTEFRYLSRSVKKPNAEILQIILKDFNAEKENTIYIGDKLHRDISMAQQAGITSVHAAYGHTITGDQYTLLKEVTHWTDEDVKEEERFKADTEGMIVSPDVVLDKSFDQVSQHFEFYAFNKSDREKNVREDRKELEKAEREDRKDGLKNIIDIWKKTVDVQQHFNDIELRIRNYALTLFTAIVAGIGLLEKDKIKFQFWGAVIPASAILSLVGLLVLAAFLYMDKYWYHKLLLGAVYHAGDIEKKYADQLPELALGTRIKAASPHYFIRKKWQIHSDDKYWIFYGLLAFPLVLLSVVLFFGHQKRGNKADVKVEAPSNVNVRLVDTLKMRMLVDTVKVKR